MKFVEKHSGLLCVKWKTKISKATFTKKNKTAIHIIRRHPSAAYDIDCNLSSKPVKEIENTYEIDGSIKCRWNKKASRKNSAMDSSFEDSSFDSDESTSSNEESNQLSVIVCPYEPHTISFAINGQKSKLIKTNKEWILPKQIITVPEIKTINVNKILLTCTIWIHFEVASHGEKNALKSFAEMFVQQKDCDVQFCFDEGHNIGAHINILSARSPVFAAMFQHNMQEASSGQVNIQDTEAEIFKQLLHYIYSGRLLNSLKEANSQALYFVAEKYDIGDLKQECIRFIASSVNVDNAINLLLFAHLQSIDLVKNEVLNFMTKNGKKIIQSDEWEKLALKYPELSVMLIRRMMK